MSYTQLKELWGFDDADLGANRMGQLTGKQRKFLEGEHKTQRGVFLGVGAVIAGLFCCLPALLIAPRVVLPMLVSGDFSKFQEWIPLAAMGGFGFVFLGMAVLTVGAVVGIYLFRAGKKADISVKRAGGVAKYIWGTKRVRTPTSSTSKYHDVKVLHLILGDKKFEVGEPLQELIREDETWTVYYTSDPFKFLSAEKG
ncbi:MAG: hypothetical protein K8S20_01210 [Chloroflexi bacterium]|nr:hypothetical protein [Chloroflexota bacterium]